MCLHAQYETITLILQLLGSRGTVIYDGTLHEIFMQQCLFVFSSAQASFAVAHPFLKGEKNNNHGCFASSSKEQQNQKSEGETQTTVIPKQEDRS